MGAIFFSFRSIVTNWMKNSMNRFKWCPRAKELRLLWCFSEPREIWDMIQDLITNRIKFSGYQPSWRRSGKNKTEILKKADRLRHVIFVSLFLGCFRFVRFPSRVCMCVFFESCALCVEMIFGIFLILCTEQAYQEMISCVVILIGWHLKFKWDESNTHQFYQRFSYAMAR